MLQHASVEPLSADNVRSCCLSSLRRESDAAVVACSQRCKQAYYADPPASSAQLLEILDSEKGIADGLLQSYIEPFNDKNEVTRAGCAQDPVALRLQLTCTRLALYCLHLQCQSTLAPLAENSSGVCLCVLRLQVLSVLWTRGSVEIERVSAQKGWAKPKCVPACAPALLHRRCLVEHRCLHRHGWAEHPIMEPGTQLNKRMRMVRGWRCGRLLRAACTFRHTSQQRGHRRLLALELDSMPLRSATRWPSTWARRLHSAISWVRWALLSDARRHCGSQLSLPVIVTKTQNASLKTSTPAFPPTRP